MYMPKPKRFGTFEDPKRAVKVVNFGKKKVRNAVSHLSLYAA